MILKDDIVKRFTETFTGEVADDVATALSCIEIDVFAELLVAMGREDLASRWIGAHASGDDEGDAHYGRTA